MFSAGGFGFLKTHPPPVRPPAGSRGRLMGGLVSWVAGLERSCIVGGEGVRLGHGPKIQGGDEAMVDDYYAHQHKVRVGDTIQLLNRGWRVSGVRRVRHAVANHRAIASAAGSHGEQRQSEHFVYQARRPGEYAGSHRNAEVKTARIIRSTRWRIWLPQ